MKAEEVSGAKVACGTPDRRLERRRAMIEAAESLFLERGYDATSVNHVIAAVGQRYVHPYPAVLQDLHGSPR